MPHQFVMQTPVAEFVQDTIAQLDEYLKKPPTDMYTKELFHTVPLQVVLGFLADPLTPEQSETVLSSLERAFDFPAVVAELLHDEHVPLLHIAVTHPDPRVRRLLARVLGKVAETEEGVSRMVQLNLFMVLLRLLEDSDTSAGASAVAGVLAAVKYPIGLQSLFAPESLDFLKNICSSSGMTPQKESVRLRVLDLFATVSSLSAEAHELVLKSAFLHDLLTLMDTKDSLVKFNVIELLEKIGQTQWGGQFLLDQGVVDRIASEAVDPNSDPLFAGRLIRLIARLYALGSVHFQHLLSPALLTSIERFLMSSDESDKTTALSAVAHIASTPNGLEAVVRQSSLLSKFVRFIDSHVIPVRAAFYEAYGSILNTSFPADDPRVEENLKVMYNTIPGDPNPMGSFMNQLRAPFPEIRAAVLFVFSGLAHYQFGVRALFSHSGFLSFLLNRESEQTKEGKELKHKTVSNVIHQTWVRSVLDPTVIEELEKYYRQGPFFMPTQAAVEVATKGS
eukprot:GILJ01003017.1.p1 GENE.GILJ01003017.1~~GILJ01003017.1.p1  ORF type:complete len:533 (-),score=92.38 GILJ01003017.1:203-1723(-)